MNDFKSLDERYSHLSVQLDEPGFAGSGFLMLARAKTVAILSSDKMLGGGDNRTGWFDVRLKDPQERPILLHNAVRQQTKMASQPGGLYEEHIFPNTVVFNADRLNSDGRLRSVSFTLHKFRNFFHYEHIENQSLHGARAQLRRELRLARRNVPGHHARRHDFFQPSDVYVVHAAPRTLRFRLDDRVYQVVTATHHATDFGSVRIEAQPVARIDFDEPVTIDEALDEVWAWRRFFVQAAMEPLWPKAISARGRADPRHGEADFYLANLDDQGGEEADPFGFRAGDAPYFRWKDRAALSQLMRSWLAKDGERRVFRVAVDRVIEGLQKRTSIEDILTLCSAVESLPEFGQRSKFSGEQIKVLVNGAVEAGKSAKIVVGADRLRGLLDMLNNQSLPGRLALLAETIAPAVAKEQARVAISAALSLRTMAAHGQSMPESVMPVVHPTIDALAGMCATYDLITCGAPINTTDSSRLLPIRRASQAIVALKYFRGR